MTKLTTLLQKLKALLIKIPDLPSNPIKRGGILFLFRALPDLDHMVPIAYKLSRQHPDMEVCFLCVEPYFQFEKLDLTRYLRSELSIKVGRIHDYSRPTFLHYFIFYVLKLFDSISRFGFGNRLISTNFFAIFYDERWMRFFLLSHDFSRIVVDRLATRKHKYHYRLVLPVAHELSIIVVSVPHSAPVIKEQIDTNSERALSRNLPERYHWIDRYIVTAEVELNHYLLCGLKPENLFIAGNPRYSKEWISIFEHYLREQYSTSDSEKSKILLVEPAHGTLKIDLYKTLLCALSSMEDVTVTVLPKPRFYKSLLNYRKFGFDVQKPNRSSSYYVQWCDIVISDRSSLIWECLIRRKAVIQAAVLSEYRDSSTTLFGEENICYQANSVDEIIVTIKGIISNVVERPNQDNVESLINKLLNANNDPELVLKRYVDILLN